MTQMRLLLNSDNDTDATVAADDDDDVTASVTSSSCGDVIDAVRLEQWSDAVPTQPMSNNSDNDTDATVAADDDDDVDDDLESPTEQRLMRHLLRRYETAVRPVRNASETVIVRMGLTLTQIFNMVSHFIFSDILFIFTSYRLPKYCKVTTEKSSEHNIRNSFAKLAARQHRCTEDLWHIFIHLLRVLKINYEISMLQGFRRCRATLTLPQPTLTLTLILILTLGFLMGQCFFNV